MSSLSEEAKIAFSKFILDWDERIETHDDLETKEYLNDILQEAVNKLHLWRSEKEVNIIESSKDEEEAAIRLKQFTESKVWRDMDRISGNLLKVKYTLNHVYELKNRRTAECFSLRAKIAKLKIK